MSLHGSHVTGKPVFDTAGQRDPFGYWHDTICSTFTSLTPERCSRDPFSGTIAQKATVGQSSMTAITSDPQIVRRTPQDIRRNPSDTLFLNFQLTGSSKIMQRGIEARVQTGAVVLLDARRPFSMKFDDPFRQACLHLPVQEITDQGAQCAAVLGRVLSPQSRASAALFQEMRVMLAGEGSPHTIQSIVSLLLRGVTETHPSRLADQHLELIRQFVRRNASDPGLCPQDVAAHFRISVRYLHRLFARSDQSFGQYLLALRLEEARRMIEETTIPLTCISVAAGFRNHSHFSRSFRSNYGTSARCLRQGRKPEQTG